MYTFSKLFAKFKKGNINTSSWNAQFFDIKINDIKPRLRYPAKHHLELKDKEFPRQGKAKGAHHHQTSIIRISGFFC